MRPIKFRAFNKEDKTICDVVRIDLFAKCTLIKLKNGRHKDFSFDDIELMQFTGLYDKNGKEVFEGDIVKDDYKRIMKIGEWRYKPCFIAVSKTNFHHADFFEWLIGDTNVLECEIIGNIHDNPELLNNEK